MKSDKQLIEATLQEHGFLPYREPRYGTGQSGFQVESGEDYCTVHFRSMHPGTPSDTLNFLRDAKLRDYLAALPTDEFKLTLVSGVKTKQLVALRCAIKHASKGPYRRK